MCIIFFLFELTNKHLTRLNRAAYIIDIANSETGIDVREGIGISEASAYENNQKVYSPDTFIFAIGNFIEYNALIKNIF